MKLLLCFLLLAGFSEVKAQSGEAAIRSILNEQVKSWNAGSLEGFMKDYWNNDSLIFIGRDGLTYGHNNVLANYKKGFPDTTSMGRLSYDVIHVKQLSPEYYYVVGKFALTRTIGNLQGHFTLLVRKINGKWVIIADQSS